MLTLFKPWRTAADLKEDYQTWEQAFSSWSFLSHHLIIMKHANIRYECKDARDDYSAQRRKMAKNSDIQNSWEEARATADFLDDLEDDSEDEQDLVVIDGEEEAEFLRAKNEKAKVNDIEYSQMESIAQNSGMYDPNSDEYKMNESIFNFELREDSRTASQWKNILQDTRKQEIENMRLKDLPANEKEGEMRKKRKLWNEVVVDDMSYLDWDYHAKVKEEQLLVDTMVNDYNLQSNKEQQRAFRIVANHVTSASPKQLLMYMGGMGGTGKSQVIKALKDFFCKRNEGYKFLVLAPTGPAAAQINGSTYHSVLCMRWNSIKKALETARENLTGVEYIFIDELSMVSCYDFYKISERLSLITHESDLPFGGINMILSGDFCQLPPVGGIPLYSLDVSKVMRAWLTEYEQKKIIGKAIWHQVTTAVILRKNIRQNTMSEDNVRFRDCLIRMRYGKCNQQDLKWLNSRVARKGDQGPDLSKSEWKYAAVINGHNSQRDKLNEMGALRFATEIQQPLYKFYSYDTWGSESDPADPSENKGRKKAKASPQQKISAEVQEEIWKLSPKYTDNIPSVLVLCIGMPVMIKINEATELCVTNGQTGNVVGWTYEDMLQYIKVIGPLAHSGHSNHPTVMLPMYLFIG